MVNRLNTDRDAAPLYIQIKSELKGKIEKGEWKTGDKIPSEMELCKLYNVSRITVREAINELVWEEYLVRHRAKGTFVLDYQQKETDKDYYTYVKSFTYEMNELGENVTTIHAEVKKIKADQALAKQLNVKEGDEVIELKRLRGMPNKVPVFFKTYWAHQSNFSLDSKDYYGSFYEMLKINGIILTNVKEYLEAVKPNEEVAQRLNISEDTPILKRVRSAKTQTGDFEEYTECFYIGESYRYYIDLTAKT
ncbi:GntR family transcriptional regulator [Fictibacillus terranigra]|uniref:GntR family transcriptional regulator n=1 Tax=Fictibacillus terranigra TaxID=3058424 RepID=A0ABT8EDL8_9BACL|nr:GntR family transcriptional regulator [Fictibacillus sp. CENA-BCM004]MDN4075981.1 GntR family transcriptional regulator [Fictibacillus sp. CENA-BCM004]